MEILEQRIYKIENKIDTVITKLTEHDGKLNELEIKASLTLEKIHRRGKECKRI